VLAGGRSKRLGRDKAMLDVAGQTLLSRTVRTLSCITKATYVSGRDPKPMGVDVPWFPDVVEGIGPMGGIIAALKQLNAPCLCVSCDLPLLSESLLNRLVCASSVAPPHTAMTTFRHEETGYIESMIAVYEPGAADLLEDALSKECYKLSVAVPEERREHLSFSEEEALAFFNINYPADLALLKRMLNERGIIVR
jgi:molybdopterin-guanine dinucleotide biosynthesis protein A